MSEEQIIIGTPSKPLTPAENNARSLVTQAGRLADLALALAQHNLHDDFRFGATVLQDVYWKMGSFVRLAEALKSHSSNSSGGFEYHGELQQVFCLIELEFKRIQHSLEECRRDSQRTMGRYGKRIQVYLGCLRVIAVHLDDETIERNIEDVFTVRQALEAHEHMERAYINRNARGYDVSREKFAVSLQESMVVCKSLLGEWERAVKDSMKDKRIRDANAGAGIDKPRKQPQVVETRSSSNSRWRAALDVFLVERKRSYRR